VQTEHRPPLRNETDLERIDRNFNELLGELRVVATGVQVLFAFLLIVPFSAGFRELATGERYVYFAILLATAAAAGLLIAPSALHRLIFRQGEKPYLVDMANRMAISGIACLMFAMTGILGLLSGHLFGWVAGVIVVVSAGGFFGTLWFGIGMKRRRRAVTDWRPATPADY
jgi:hypothetical protein